MADYGSVDCGGKVRRNRDGAAGCKVAVKKMRAEVVLTDDESDFSEVCDSEFGLSDYQLGSFCQQLSDGPFEVALNARDEDDRHGSYAARARTKEQLYAEYGLSDAQLRSFGRLCSASEDPLRSKGFVLDRARCKDPLRYFLDQRRATNRSTRGTNDVQSISHRRQG